MAQNFGFLIWVTLFLSILLGLLQANWIIVYWVLYRKAKEEYIINRFPKITLFMGISSCIYHLIGVPWAIIGDFMLPTEYQQIFILVIISHAFNQILTVPSSWTILARLYIIYYQLKYCESIDNEQWVRFIKKDYKTENYYIRNKNTIGNPTFICWGLGIIYVILSLSYFILTIHYQSNTWIVPGVSTYEEMIITAEVILPIFPIIYLLCKFPTYSDVFLVYKEAKVFSIGYCICVSIAIATVVVIPKDYKYYTVLTTLSAVFAQLQIHYSLFQFVFRQYGLPWNIFHLKRYLYLRLSEMNIDYSISKSNKRDRSNSSAPQTRMEKAFKNEELISLFAKHLNSEFCIESLLFLLEFSQYKQQIRSLYAKDLSNDTETHDIDDLVFSNTIPTSEINELIKANNISTVKDAANKLFNKYINDKQNMPDFMINISYLQKKNLFTEFEEKINNNQYNVNIIELYHLFDIGGREILKLIKPAWKRFLNANQHELP